MSWRACVIVACAAALHAPARRTPPPRRHGAVDGADATRVDAAHPLVGRRLTVRGVPLARGAGDARYSSLKCFAEPGDPYAAALPYVLSHGDAVTCLGFRDFTGQSWVLHEVDETARGLTSDGRPPAARAYPAWSHMDFQGHRWLVVDPPLVVGDDGGS